MIQKIFACVIVLLDCLVLAPSTSIADTLEPQDILQTTQVGGLYDPPEVQLSPNGRFVAFTARKTLLHQNSYVFNLYIVSTVAGSAPVQITHNAPVPGGVDRMFLSPRWSPDAKQVAFFATRNGKQEVVAYNLRSKSIATLVADVAGGYNSNRAGGLVTGFDWSPDGENIAYTVAGVVPYRAPDKNRGVPVTTLWRPLLDEPDLGLFSAANGFDSAPLELVVADLTTHRKTRITNQPFNVEEFSWSPDSRHLAFAASTRSDYVSYMSAKIYTVDIGTGAIETVVNQPGPNSAPSWSPNGKYIAFETHYGTIDWDQTQAPAVVALASKHITYANTHPAGLLESFRSTHIWSKDSTGFYFTSSEHLCSHLFFFRTSDGNIAQVDRGNETSCITQLTGTSEFLAFTQESAVMPRRIFITAISSFHPRLVLDMNPEKTLGPKPSEELVSWRSSDKRWDVHGILLKPPSFNAHKSYPLIVFVQGGPGMVSGGYGLSNQYPLLTFAERGYLVFAPNTRGRGGYGSAFDHAIRSEHSYVALPFSDILSGLDFLEKQGYVDVHRVGILGFSYGGLLTAYAVGHTDRFAAASVGEGPTDLLPWVLLGGGRPEGRALVRDLMGYGDIYSVRTMQQLLIDSPLWSARNIKTPTRLEYGVNSMAQDQGRIFFQGLQRFSVPSEFVVYPRSEHGLTEPLLLLDGYQRNLDWFERWMPTR